MELDESRIIETRVAPTEDPRLPMPGTELVRRYRGGVRISSFAFGRKGSSTTAKFTVPSVPPYATLLARRGTGSRFLGWAASQGGSVAATNNVALAPKPVRCAIYTRKSTDEGLNQEFNSLDAQREAGEAYILSQRHAGWTLVPNEYSDGGYTGANIERPGVKQLLADIEARKVDCVVVYKVDRLSRSLIDFSKMMELFEKHGVCFVSVTQQFNTNSSLGRLTLNILLSFAQFEREIDLRSYDFGAAIKVLKQTDLQSPPPMYGGVISNASIKPRPEPIDNTMLVVGAESGTFYQRVPVPVGMWRPFNRSSVPVRLGRPGVLVIGHQRAAVLICYEQMLVFPVLASMLQHPTVNVGISNTFWVDHTTIPRYQANALRAWAKLFRLPYFLAVNS